MLHNRTSAYRQRIEPLRSLSPPCTLATGVRLETPTYSHLLDIILSIRDLCALSVPTYFRFHFVKNKYTECLGKKGSLMRPGEKGSFFCGASLEGFLPYPVFDEIF